MPFPNAVVDAPTTEERVDMNNTKLKGIALSTAVAGLFAVACAGNAFAADDAKVQCEKSTSCKGKSACMNSANSCQGQNACKGLGMTMQKSDKDCTDAQTLARNLLDKAKK
jgi:heme A synthase